MSPVTAATRVEWSSRLAEALVKGGYETESHLAPLLAESRATGESLATLLISRNLSTPGVVVGALAHLSQLPAIDLQAVHPTPDAQAAMPASVATEFGAVALQFEGNVLAVACAEPPTPGDVDALAARLGFRINPVLADPVLIAQVLQSTKPPPPPGPGSDSPLVDSQVDEERPSTEPNLEQILQQGIAAVAADSTMALHIDDLLRYAVAVGASDLHLTANMPGSIRLHGAIRPIEGSPVLSNEEIRDMVFGILPASQRERFEEELELDTSHTIAGVGRFRTRCPTSTRWASPTRSRRSPTFGADWCWSPVRPDRVSRPRWRR